MIPGDLPLWIALPTLFVFGAVVGSFLNVCIYRIPQQASLWEQLRGLTHPPSTCPFCRKLILAMDNVPILGWLLLRGRCRFCRHHIPIRYALIEFFNGLLWVGLYLAIVPAGYGATLQQSCLWSSLSPLSAANTNPAWIPFYVNAQYFYYLILAEALLVATFIDFDLRIIPDGVTVPAMIAGVLGAVLIGRLHPWPVWFQNPETLRMFDLIVPERLHWLLRGPAQPAWQNEHPHLHGLASSLAGIVIGGGLVWLVRIIGQYAMKREAMGFGDVILMGMIGSFVGWQMSVVIFFVAPACALFSVALTFLFRRSREIPYGPYLSIATLLTILFWKNGFSHAESWFDLGPLILIQALFLFIMLALTLMLVQSVKRGLGITDPVDEEEWVWESGDQLAFYANKDAKLEPHPLQPSAWPGVTSGLGTQHANRWRHGNR